MTNVLQFAPCAYVSKLLNLKVPDYSGAPDGVVKLSTYLSANAHFGGSAAASVLLQAIRTVVKNKPEQSIASTTEFARVFTGQGMPGDTMAAWVILNKYQDEFRKIESLKKYFKETNFLQAMVDGKCFGLDCIGFVGTYFASAGLTVGYQAMRPLDYANRFKPVKSIDEIDDRCIIMLTSGEHIQIIDEVILWTDTTVTLVLCQSSSGGPQTNVSVTLSAGGGSYLPVDDFRKALSGKTRTDDYNSDQADRAQKGLKSRDYETYLRATMTQANQPFGYMGGAIFQLSRNGRTANPVGGSVYVGRMPGGLPLASYDMTIPVAIAGV
jgi:hypothetical protein